MLCDLKVLDEGHADIGLNRLDAVCGFCGKHDMKDARIEFNFRDQKIYYYCTECKKANMLDLGKKITPPLPKTRLGR